MQRVIGLIGNPNVGKSSLFNALTGKNASVGNWPGVTVARQVGAFVKSGTNVTVIDLPGCYACCGYTEEGSLDEEEVLKFILNETVDLFINVIDARCLQRHLYLTCQLLELGVPMIVVVNMADLLTASLDIEMLEKKLGCDVIIISAKYKKGIIPLKNKIVNHALKAAPVPPVPDSLSIGHKNLVNAMISIKPDMSSVRAHWLARRWLEGDTMTKMVFDKQHRFLLQNTVQGIIDNLSNDPDLLLADQRYTFINDLLNNAHLPTVKQSTLHLDKWFLHKWLGLPIFFLFMYSVFYISIVVGGWVQDYLSGIFEILLIDIPLYSLHSLLPNNHWLLVLFHGAGVGLNTVISLLPVIIITSGFLYLLEETGYMARAAFLVDRLMIVLKLPGKAFIAMILGFGCNVPAISATRTLASFKDRAMTIMMVPFMSCTARLTVYTALTSLFFKSYGAVVVFGLYFLGFLVGLLTAFLLRCAWGKVESVPVVIDFPAYQLPSIHNVIKQLWRRSWQFLRRASKIIVTVSVVLSILNLGSKEILMDIGQGLAWLLSPMGMMPSQWPEAIALLTGILAKEVVVGTLNNLYASNFSIDYGSWTTIVANLKVSFLNHSSADAAVLTKIARANLEQNSIASVLAYLSFILLYLPCISTLIVIAKELNWRWAFWGLAWSTAGAYSISVLIYQTSLGFAGINIIIMVLVFMLIASLLLVRWAKSFEGAV